MENKVSFLDFLKSVLFLIIGSLSTAIVVAAVLIAWKYFHRYEIATNYGKISANGSKSFNQNLFNPILPRTDLKKEIFSSLSSSRNYFLIVGETGVGKSTFMKELAKNDASLLVTVPPDAHLLGSEWAREFNWDPSSSELLQYYKEFPEYKGGIEFNLVMKGFEEYRQRFGHAQRPFILIFDNIDTLAQQDPQKLLNLQLWAKKTAEDESFITKVIFVSNVGLTPEILLKQSTSSSMKIIEILDPSKDEIFELISQHIPNLSNEKKEEVFEITGGRLIDVFSFIDGIKRGNSVEMIKNEKFLKISREWAPLMRFKSREEMTLKALEKLLPLPDRKPISIPWLEFYHFIREKNENQLYERYKEGEDNYSVLLKYGVISYHLPSDTVTIQSDLHRSFSIEKFFQNSSSLNDQTNFFGIWN